MVEIFSETKKNKKVFMTKFRSMKFPARPDYLNWRFEVADGYFPMVFKDLEPDGFIEINFKNFKNNKGRVGFRIRYDAPGGDSKFVETRIFGADGKLNSFSALVKKLKSLLNEDVSKNRDFKKALDALKKWDLNDYKKKIANYQKEMEDLEKLVW